MELDDDYDDEQAVPPTAAADTDPTARVVEPVAAQDPTAWQQAPALATAAADSAPAAPAVKAHWVGPGIPKFSAIFSVAASAPRSVKRRRDPAALADVPAPAVLAEVPESSASQLFTRSAKASAQSSTPRVSRDQYVLAEAAILEGKSLQRVDSKAMTPSAAAEVEAEDDDEDEEEEEEEEEMEVEQMELEAKHGAEGGAEATRGALSVRFAPTHPSKTSPRLPS